MAVVSGRRFAPESRKEIATMKTFLTRFLLLAFVVVLGLGAAGQAQAQTVVKCDVPFTFSLGGQVFPSGVYAFTIGSGSGSKIVLLRAWDGSRARFLQAGVEDESNSVETLLRFNHYGDHYLLSSLSIAGESISLQFTPTRAEREMMVRAHNEVVSVLASR
jgi:hypothetical protein